MKKKDSDWINDVVENIMIWDGPDRHTDGSDVITDFIMTLRDGTEDKWVEQYEKIIEQKQKEREAWSKRWCE